VRYVFAGAERVKDETRRVWMETFGIRILEGYGATETAPVLAVNTPMHAKAGTVGRLLPGIEHRLEPVPGVDEGGRLWVKGPNVMLGYYRVERPGQLEPPEDGWYDTGDIVTVDELRFVRILGRAKRFAKIAGEMVSLGKVETEISALWPDSQHAVVAVADERKGEQLVLVTDRQDAARDAILAHFRAQGLAELLAPKVVLKVEKVPLLGTGKTDYVTAKSLAEVFVGAGGTP
jgi:acyl-[acyl-carrier-protein]-phospholipid O-acyltransferase/long-chain-fatty-acid--[acyl-carrier-protein] ligase